MAYSQESYERLAFALGAMPGLTEKKMFGGVCFMLNGNMLAGVMKAGPFARVGKHREAHALSRDGVELMAMKARDMRGFVRLAPEVVEDDARLSEILNIAISFVGPMPPK